MMPFKIKIKISRYILLATILIQAISANIIELIHNNQIPVQLAEDRCIRGAGKGSYDILLASCDYKLLISVNIWSKIDKYEEDGINYFKLSYSPENTSFPNCISHISDIRSSNAILSHCNSEFALDLFQDGDRIKVKHSNPNRPQRCLLIEDSHHPESIPNLQIKVKKCADKLIYHKEGTEHEYQIRSVINDYPVYIENGNKKVFPTVDSQNKKTPTPFIIRRDGRIMVKGSGDSENLTDDNSMCLSGRMRKKKDVMTRKTLVVKCNEATKFYVDDNNTDNDQEIHPISRKTGKILYLKCLVFTKYPKTTDAKFRLVVIPCQRNLGYFDRYSYKGDPNDPMY